MHFDLIDLELFLNVAETRSITGGAQRSQLALASASARIKGMEVSLGAPLLTRGRRGVVLTAAGQALIRHSRVVLGQLERMRGELCDCAKGLRGTIRLLCDATALAGILPEALSTFLVNNPDIDIDIEEQPGREIVAAIIAGKEDMGIVADCGNHGELETIPFHSYRLALATARSHPLSARENPAIADALDYDFIGLTGDNALMEYLADQATKGGKTLKLRARLANPEAICRMVERNAGVGVMPEEAALRSQQFLDIQVIGMKEPWAFRQLVLCVRKRDELPGHVMELLKHLRSG